MLSQSCSGVLTVIGKIQQASEWVKLSEEAK